jgi:hypothetical protein
MSTRANIFDNLKTMFVGNQSLLTTKVTPLVETSEGIVFGISKITSVATTAGYYTSGQSFAPGCFLLCVTAAANSVRFVTNTGTKAAMSATGVIS